MFEQARYDKALHLEVIHAFDTAATQGKPTPIVLIRDNKIVAICESHQNIPQDLYAFPNVIEITEKPETKDTFKLAVNPSRSSPVFRSSDDNALQPISQIMKRNGKTALIDHETEKPKSGFQVTDRQNNVDPDVVAATEDIHEQLFETAFQQQKNCTKTIVAINGKIHAMLDSIKGVENMLAAKVSVLSIAKKIRGRITVSHALIYLEEEPLPFVYEIPIH